MEKAEQLYISGHYKECFQELQSLSVEEESPQVQVKYNTLMGTVTLKLSLLRQAREHVQKCFALLKTWTQKDAYFIKSIYENGLNLQKIEYWLCRYRESEEINLMLLDFLRQYMPESLSERCEVLTQLGNTYRAWCRYELAKESLEQAYQIYQNHKEQLDVMTATNILFVKARFCMDTDSTQFAMELANKCLEMREQYFAPINPNHIEIAYVNELIGKLYFSKGQTQQGEKYHNLAYDAKIAILGEHNFESIDSINERGRIMLCKKREQEARKYFQLLGTISLDLLGPVNQYQALSYNNLGCVYYNEKKYEESIEHHIIALRLYEQLCGHDHYKLVFALNQMAYCHKNLGRHKTAIALWERCVHILKRTVGPPTQKNIQTIDEQIKQSLTMLEE